jgi:glyoxylase-like metal-dependent hydrolase (beta-lactamase superfamily II)
VRELADGVWHWEARHPEWTPEEGGLHGWGPEVSSYAVATGDRLLVFDPVGLPSELEELARSRVTAVVLTCPWHRRDAIELAQRLGAPIHVPPPDPPDPAPVPGEVFRAGDRLAVGIEALPGMEENDLVLWVPSRRALVAGDTLIDTGDGLRFPRDWAVDKPGGPDAILASLRPLLDLPVELVLPTHGAPADRAALERALAA